VGVTRWYGAVGVADGEGVGEDDGDIEFVALAGGFALGVELPHPASAVTAIRPNAADARTLVGRRRMV
jgi:hypothetical protein